MTIEDSKCDHCKNGTYQFNNYCGAFVCTKCGDHHNLGQCFCGWNIHKADMEAMYQEKW